MLMSPQKPSKERSSIMAGLAPRRVAFVTEVSTGQTMLAQFTDPETTFAVWQDNTNDGLEVLILPMTTGNTLGANEELLAWVAEGQPAGAALPVAITMHGAHIIWGLSRIVIQASPERTELYLSATLDFWYHEHELRKLEREIRENWSTLKGDQQLAYTITRDDPERFALVGQRMNDMLQRRMNLARLRPHLYEPRPHALPLANQLLERLREKAHVDERYESIQAQLEVFERSYEMSSQRINDHKLARKSHTLELVIILLLAAEVALLIVSYLASTGK